MNHSHGKGRLYPAYSLSGSEGEDNTSSLRSRVYPQNNHQTNQPHHNHYNTSQHKQRIYQQQQQQHPLYHMPGSGAGLSDTPTSGNASDETLTDSDLITVARDSALLVHNVGELIYSSYAATEAINTFHAQVSTTLSTESVEFPGGTHRMKADARRMG
ncbi:uncharacterized protein LOC126853556 [Cataglyphis hispanica]|uniref:uncharacterized protein LOC126853556 n=1 Tax=Cataglyphis hispanica TaxID=1086592 RepID=UPI00217F4247|nr:uncharacterized protein LOC126853556 [Cataglyphis hispanica]